MKKKPKPLEPKKPQPKMWNEEVKSTKKKSLENEQRLSKEIGFVCTPGSGNGPWASKKGDGTHPIFMFECKETKHASIRIAGKDIRKLVQEAALVGKFPALVVSAYRLSEPLPKDWVAVPGEAFKWILEQLEES